MPHSKEFFKEIFVDLLDRYLQAVSFWLPKRQKDDIVAELSEELRSQMEEKESTLGRKLTDSEVEGILKGCGSPLAVAGRYLPQQSLIGPTLFPLYRFVLGVVLAGCVIPRCLIWLGFLIANPSHAGYLHMENLWSTVVFLGFYITLAFAIFERSGVKFVNLVDWNPRSLPPVRHPNRIPRANSLAEIAFGLIFVAWFAGLFYPRPVIDLYDAQISLAPVWSYFFYGFLLLSGGNLLLACVNLANAYWTRPRATIRLLLDAAGGVLFSFLVRSHVLVSVGAASLSPEKSAALTTWLNAGMPSLFPWCIVVVLVIVAVDGYRIMKLGKYPMSPVLGVQVGT
jgi:hypothetical protein